MLSLDTSELRRREETSRKLFERGNALLTKGDHLNAKIKFKEGTFLGFKLVVVMTRACGQRGKQYTRADLQWKKILQQWTLSRTRQNKPHISNVSLSAPNAIIFSA